MGYVLVSGVPLISLFEKGRHTWEAWMVSTTPRKYTQRVTTTLAGKYTSFLDSYMTLMKALQYAAMAC
ncbi:uncharacterized protein BCR38DRAFT_448761 [Pseudomassariella vexata]|uniref:Uncharacterized protein n=1 Tax=Pseudomassariella vexata TaxID=1141098 RepID=A0A1Y2DEW7_9PEZI|nr:uncharacterized protein BCR38DRAFT_448761 [Pseudomassariella vexata]ORY57823.1 hypothetical protein BCR38DRAFT_448761 [Pseudomassariella vexata]